MSTAVIDAVLGAGHYGDVAADVHLRQTSPASEMEATLAALSADAASAERLLRRPRCLPARSRGAPRLWDGQAIDPRPDDCWRCDAALSADALGLCPDCRNDLCR